MVVLTRNEHCPPHVHVGERDWDARFQFSFWHQGVFLWDVAPSERAPRASLLAEFQERLKDPAMLRRARTIWWTAFGSTCLENQRWDPERERVVSPREASKKAMRIVSARYDVESNSTRLQLVGGEEVEIEL